jgi:hypothetical protein
MELHEISAWLTGLPDWPRLGPAETAYLNRHRLPLRVSRLDG